MAYAIDIEGKKKPRFFLSVLCVGQEGIRRASLENPTGAWRLRPNDKVLDQHDRDETNARVDKRTHPTISKAPRSRQWRHNSIERPELK
jgi:hypothetical protein